MWKRQQQLKAARSIFLITSSPLEAYLMKKVDDAAQCWKMEFECLIFLKKNFERSEMLPGASFSTYPTEGLWSASE